MPRGSKDVSTAAAALRDSFGDRKIPDISRKITACVACRKLKIKCEITDAEEPCARCKARGLSCTVNRSLQMLLESDAEWKERMERRIEVLEEGMKGARGMVVDVPSVSPPSGESTVAARQRQRVPDLADSETPGLPADLGAFPATSPQQDDGPIVHPPAKNELDLVSAGVLTRERAEALVGYFQEHLNRQLHHILEPAVTIGELRSRSTLLVAATCTVAALCSGAGEYPACEQALRREVSDRFFQPKYSFDEVRALCISSFWLGDLSAALGSLAVRISAQLNLHRCITKMPHRKAECYERTRLYYQVYLCDHHCSLKHGRPPMTQEWRSLQVPGALLRSEHSRHTDLALISQVELWAISRRVFESFGADVNSSDASKRLADIAMLDAAFQDWRRHWLETMAVDAGVCGWYKTELYYHEARLSLFSHIFRGSRQTDNPPDSTVAGPAQAALESAISVIRIFTESVGSDQRLCDLPSYHESMAAYATAYLLKAAASELAAAVSIKEESTRLLRVLSERLNYLDHGVGCSRPILTLKTNLSRVVENMPSTSVPRPSDESMDFTFDSTLLSDDFWNMDFTLPGDDWLQCIDH